MDTAGYISGSETASPLRSRLRTRRTRRLTSPRARRRLAEQLERMIEAAEMPQVLRGSAAPVNRREIRRPRDVLRALAKELASDDPVTSRGVLMIERLLRDGASPMYATDVEGLLELELRHARAALLLN